MPLELTDQALVDRVTPHRKVRRLVDLDVVVRTERRVAVLADRWRLVALVTEHEHSGPDLPATVRIDQHEGFDVPYVELRARWILWVHVTGPELPDHVPCLALRD